MDKHFPAKISVIVTTYNWPYALSAVLNALADQKTQFPYEIIIADDGSLEETAKLVRDFKSRVSIPLLHIWQPDEGFRAAAIRNKALLISEGDYIIFLDGDCIPNQNFIQNHLELIEKNTFVVGSHVLLSREFTLTALAQALPLHRWSFGRWISARFSGQCNRILPFLPLPFRHFGFKTNSRWRGARGSNLGVWKSDLLKVNGWEEKFTGWGYEDCDLVTRLLQQGVIRKSCGFRIPVVHLWHAINDRTKERANWALLKERRKNKQLCAEQGINQYVL